MGLEPPSPSPSLEKKAAKGRFRAAWAGWGFPSLGFPARTAGAAALERPGPRIGGGARRPGRAGHPPAAAHAFQKSPGSPRTPLPRWGTLLTARRPGQSSLPAFVRRVCAGRVREPRAAPKPGPVWLFTSGLLLGLRNPTRARARTLSAPPKGNPARHPRPFP
ncbi:uncharacterized protein LOC141546025 isoform X2 [Sminthopsis crassicaudata]|uniref:uncharacterized protein LOC141546025 isoform X2 n=1 Tax=Sminthopsis crassicaudata TaxID=9301 RepID=UPI003D68F458